MDNDDDSGGSTTNRQACAACKHQRKKCSQQCMLSPFFPADMNQQFQAVHKLFGVSNVTKLLRSLPIEERKPAIDSLIWEAQCRELDPILGCYGQYNKIVNELQLLKNQQQQQEVMVGAAAAQTHDHAEINMMNKPYGQLLIDYHPPYHHNGINTGLGADTTVVNYSNNNGYLQRNAGGLIMEQQSHDQHGYPSSNNNVQAGQEKRFQRRDHGNSLVYLPNSFNHQNQTYYYDSRKS